MYEDNVEGAYSQVPDISYLLPPPGTDWKFEPEEGEVVYMSKD